MNIDWSKAPEGATHFAPDGKGVSARWFDMDHGRVFHDGKWINITYWAGREDLIKRPDEDQRQWTGSGLPPVGTVCEIRAHKLNDWSPATIKFASRNVIVWDWEAEPALNGLCTAYAHAVEIRPIRTPEQIAAEAKEKEVLALADELAGYQDRETGRMHEALARYLYENGYRKQVTS